MSLLLRQACQDILDSHRLAAYHVDINPHTRTMEIVNSCGRSAIVCNGIRFSRLTPYKTEVYYAVELLLEFLNKHNQLINEYIELVRLYKPIDRVDLTKKYTISPTMSSIEYRSSSNSNLIITINNKGEILEYKRNFRESPVHYYDDITIKVNLDELALYQNILNEYINQEQIARELRNIENKFKACSI